MQVTAIVAAAGMGTRLGFHKPKALVELAGEPLLVRAIHGLRRAGVEQIVVTVPDQEAAVAQFEEILRTAGISGAVLTPGGQTRQESVDRGLAAVVSHFPSTTHVLVHDAARALTPESVIRRVLGLLAVGARAVIPVLPVTDTIKEIEPDTDAQAAAELMGENPGPAYTEKVVRTAVRSRLRAVQTPQGFELATLQEAHISGAQLNHDERASAPDDAALVELNGGEVRTVPGDERSLKITTKFDLQVAQLLVNS